MTSKTTYAALLIAVALIAETVQAADQVPKLVNYQGRLTDATGQPLSNEAYRVSFKLFDSPTASTGLIWGATYTNVAVVNGQFNVVLGAAGGNPISGTAVSDISLAFTTSERYLELSVIAGAITNTIAPRQQILASPFALHAASVSDGVITAQKVASDVGVWTKAGAEIFYTNGSVGIGTATPTTPLHVFGGATFSTDYTEGSVLMIFDIHRGWVLQQSGTGSSTALEWRSASGKNFIINTTGTLDVRGHAAVAGDVGGAAFLATADAGASGVVAKGQYYRDNSIVAWGRVDLNGNLGEDYGVTSVTKPADGTFNVTMDAAMVSAASMAVSVTPVGTSPRLVAVQVTGTRTFTVRLYQVVAQTGPLISATDFSFIVTGR